MREDRTTLLASESHMTMDTDALGELLNAKYPLTIETRRHCLRFYKMVAAHLHPYRHHVAFIAFTYYVIF